MRKVSSFANATLRNPRLEEGGGLSTTELVVEVEVDVQDL